ncbi:MAG TPA: long-chain-fatty-acid--CoA ligase [Steroidobacteraceae bacterium]|jgi:fatty-acyl-CoA synthase|nr:long-chain-fatty-acid--CoA ligase [Steroidobacteraceae bacterium]
MSDRHFAFWPTHAARHLDAPAVNLYRNVEASARRHPAKPCIVYYDTPVTFGELHDATLRLAGFLEHRCEVRAGDRVLLFMQNCPQFVIGYYAILRANAVVVPVNPMNLTRELERYAEDCAARTILVAQELFARVEPLLASGKLATAVVAAYSDHLRAPTTLSLPDFVAARSMTASGRGVFAWRDALAADLRPGALTAGADDLCVMPYTSGTTGLPRGCMHTHRTAMHTAMSGIRWFDVRPESTLLSVAPMFHVTGMQGAMNAPLLNGNTVVMLSRWDRDAAAECVQRYGAVSFTAIPTMVQDFFANPRLSSYDLSSLRRLTGGGAAMAAAVAQRLLDLGIPYCEGYGLTETIGATHQNPVTRPKKQCLGMPSFDVDSRIVAPDGIVELAPGEAGEIIVCGPQVFLGYWDKPADTAAAFVDIGGKRFLRTGDIGEIDEDGYFFMVDRLKRMINASGYKVWPSEVESSMYQHPAVLEACVIGVKDSHRGQTVKALIVTRPEWRGRLVARELIDWCRENMAVYKCPRLIEFVDSLPRSGAGKILWRELEERERAAETGTGDDARP